MRNVILTAAAIGALAGAANADIFKNYKWDGQIAIPDNGGPNGVGVTASIVVPPDPGMNVIADLDVDVLIAHTWQGDLIINLTSPQGTTVPLIYRPGDSNGTSFGYSANNLGNPATGDKFVFDDGAAAAYDSSIGWGSTPDPGISNVSGSWIPYGQFPGGPLGGLNAFNGEQKDGTWTLFVSDNAAADTGTLLNFGLAFTNIPAPGAAAVLGLAGLAAVRRRR
jgi:uncharacterized protein (TIGR03382 family)